MSGLRLALSVCTLVSASIQPALLIADATDTLGTLIAALTASITFPMAKALFASDARSHERNSQGETMIEMRWIMVPVGSGRGLIGGSGSQLHESVLQYRFQVGTQTVEGIPAMVPTPLWSEWKDATPPGFGPF